jgi:glycosyltransferase involved in cell wall biosynthesis
MPDISVIICTHNPRLDYLQRVLDALKAQTLPKEKWELLLIDNCSSSAVQDSYDLSWHSQGKHLYAKPLGKTHAMLKGIAEAKADLLIVVDDDNVLHQTYLDVASTIEGQYKILGAWGGSLIGNFESPPPPWAIKYLNFLAVREVHEDCWTNDPSHWKATPLGAGLCVRRSVAEEYAAVTVRDSLRTSLDRIGKSLMGGGDIDLVRTSCRLGLGFGVFHRLKLEHLIASRRLELGYLASLVEGGTVSYHVLNHLGGKTFVKPRFSLRAVVTGVYNRVTLPLEERTLLKSQTQAWRLAEQLIKSMEKLPRPRG